MKIYVKFSVIDTEGLRIINLDYRRWFLTSVVKPEL